MAEDSELPKLTYRMRWSPPDQAYIAWTDQYPDIRHHDEFSTAGAVAGLRGKLLDFIAQQPLE